MAGAFAVLDLAALRHNFLQVRSYAPQAKIMAVVKANAYGHGLLRVAETLADADGFAVARVEEGMLLREAGLAVRITVMEGFLDRDELELCARLRLEPVVHCARQIDLLGSDEGEPVAVWLKVDSGMHRMGVAPEDFHTGWAALQRSPRVKPPVGVMTHLACADELTHPLNLQQINVFRRLTSGCPAEKSIANSAAIVAWPQAHAEWVRPGLMLYGVSPLPDKTAAELGLRPVMHLYARLLNIKQIPIGATVGYGATFNCQRQTQLGIAAIGYGDGYPRQLPSGAPVLIRGRPVPLVGRVSMDLVTIDLTDCPEAQIGDTVTLWGEGLPIEQIALHSGTVPYTLLCGVTTRVRQVERDERGVAGVIEGVSGRRQQALLNGFGAAAPG